MSTNRFAFLITAGFLSGMLCAFSAMAQVAAPANPYHQLAPVALAPEQAPRLQHGFASLHGQEPRYRESLQLRGAVEKISAPYGQRKISHPKRKPRTIRF